MLSDRPVLEAFRLFRREELPEHQAVGETFRAAMSGRVATAEWDPYAPGGARRPARVVGGAAGALPGRVDASGWAASGPSRATTTSSRSRGPPSASTTRAGRSSARAGRRSRSTGRSTRSSGACSSRTSRASGSRSSSPAVRGFVAEMLEPALAAGEGDLAEALTYPLPARTLCLWLGLPDEEWVVPEGRRGEALRRRGGARRRPGDARRLQRGALRLLAPARARAGRAAARSRRST